MSWVSRPTQPLETPVIQELWVRVPSSQPGYEVLEGDVEFELEPIYGIGGTLRLRDVQVISTMRRSLRKKTKS